jgi:hypothetical protein
MKELLTMRLITKETKALSRGLDATQPRQEPWHDGITIKSAEGLRFAYSSITPLQVAGSLAVEAQINTLTEQYPAVRVD